MWPHGNVITIGIENRIVFLGTAIGWGGIDYKGTWRISGDDAGFNIFFVVIVIQICEPVKTQHCILISESEVCKLYLSKDNNLNIIKVNMLTVYPPGVFHSGISTNKYI